MKKKISLLLCLMMTAIVCLTGCGKTQTTLEYDEAMIEQETEFLINYCQNVDSDTLAQWNDQNEFSKEYQFMMSGLKFTPDSFDGAVDSWQAGIKECGEYVGHGDYTFEAKDDELTVSVPAQFKNRDATIEFVFDKDLYLESMTVSAKDLRQWEKCCATEFILFQKFNHTFCCLFVICNNILDTAAKSRLNGCLIFFFYFNNICNNT